MSTAHKHTILYAEDDPDDLFVVRQAFEQYDGESSLIHVSNGFEAMQQLSALQAAGHLPCLVILDINMPGMDGKEALIRIKQNERLKKIPIALFTTSSSDSDKAFARKWDAHFITKPLIYAELQELAKTFLKLCHSAVSENAVQE